MPTSGESEARARASKDVAGLIIADEVRSEVWKQECQCSAVIFTKLSIRISVTSY